MDQAQFQDWYDFSDRMARKARPGMSGPAKARLVRTVGKVLREAVARHGLDAFEDWDCAPYPGEEFEDMLVRDGYLSRSHPGADPVGEIGLLAMCCLRAGFDVAVAPSAGVAGAEFTVDLIRRMYPEGVPPFVRRHLDGTGTDIGTAPGASRVWL